MSLLIRDSGPFCFGFPMTIVGSFIIQALDVKKRAGRKPLLADFRPAFTMNLAVVGGRLVALAVGLGLQHAVVIDLPTLEGILRGLLRGAIHPTTAGCDGIHLGIGELLVIAVRKLQQLFGRLAGLPFPSTQAQR